MGDNSTADFPPDWLRQQVAKANARLDAAVNACAGHAPQPCWVRLWPVGGWLRRRQRRALVCRVCWRHLGVTEDAA